MNQQDLIPLTEVPNYRHVTLRRVRELKSKGLLPIYQLGGTNFVSLADFDRLFIFRPATRGPLASPATDPSYDDEREVGAEDEGEVQS